MWGKFNHFISVNTDVTHRNPKKIMGKDISVTTLKMSLMGGDRSWGRSAKQCVGGIAEAIAGIAGGLDGVADLLDLVQQGLSVHLYHHILI
jgi:hypothetical protein